MFIKGIVTKTVKEMVFDPIMNPETAKEPVVSAQNASVLPTQSEFDPEAFDRSPGISSSAFDPDSFDQAPAAKRAIRADRHEADPVAARALIQETWDIQLPFYPGEDSACGSACRCTWLIEKRWSSENGCNALFASWVSADDDGTCTDCRRRAAEWYEVFVRPVFDDE